METESPRSKHNVAQLRKTNVGNGEDSVYCPSLLSERKVMRRARNTRGRSMSAPVINGPETPTPTYAEDTLSRRATSGLLRNAWTLPGNLAMLRDHKRNPDVKQLWTETSMHPAQYHRLIRKGQPGGRNSCSVTITKDNGRMNVHTFEDLLAYEEYQERQERIREITQRRQAIVRDTDLHSEVPTEAARGIVKDLQKNASHHSQTRKTNWKREKRRINQFIKDRFRNLHSRVFVVPPTLFNMIKLKQHEIIKGLHLYDITPQSSTRSDEARERVISVFEEGIRFLYKDEAAIIMSGIAFEYYLHKPLQQDVPKPHAEKQMAPLPRPEDMDPQFRRGEIDVMILVKDQGIIILNIKAVGDNFAEINESEQETRKLVHKVLEKALAHVRKEKEVVMHLVSDINTCTIPVSCVLVLPNLRRHQLTKALDSNIELRAELEICFRKTAEIVCLCAEDLPPKHHPVDISILNKFAEWWGQNFATRANVVTDDAYEDIVGRFCGPLSTPRAEVQTPGQAVSETARRLSMLAITEQQQQILDCKEPLVYLSGPPGSGKTLLLVLKAVQWLRGGNYVGIVSLRQGPSPGALIIEHQIKQMLAQYRDETKPPLKDDVDQQTVLEPNSLFLSQSCFQLVGRLRNNAGGRPMLVIMDDLQLQGRQAVRWLVRYLTHPVSIEQDGLSQDCVIWCAGAWARNCPPGFQLKNLAVALRCPPAVQTVLQLVEPSPSAEEPSPYIAPNTYLLQEMSETSTITQEEIEAFIARALSTLTLSERHTLTLDALTREPPEIITIQSEEKKASEPVATQTDFAASVNRTRSVATQSETTTSSDTATVCSPALIIQPEVKMTPSKPSESCSTQTEPIVTAEAMTVPSVSVNKLVALLKSIIAMGFQGQTTPLEKTPEISTLASETITKYHYVTSSTDTVNALGLPLHTTGLKVKLFDHQHHADLAVLACAQCAEQLAQYLNSDLGVGRDIMPEDILILTSDTAALQKDPQPVFSQVLGQKMVVNIETVVNYDGSQKVLAFPTKGSITLTGVQFAIGLKNKVVVFIPEGNPRPAAEKSLCVDTKDVGKDSMCPDTEMQKKVSTADNEKDDDREDDNEKRPISLKDADGDSLKCQSNAHPEDKMVPSSSSELEDDKASCSSFNEVDKMYPKHANRLLKPHAKRNVVTCNETWTNKRDSELMSDDERLRQAVKRLSQLNRDRMWYAVSRALGHAIIFFFQNE